MAGRSEVSHRLGRYEVTVATGFGPRIVGLRAEGGPELLIRLDPELTLDAGPVGRFRFMGGHRLWASPEVPHVTYAPDDRECAAEADGDRIRVVGSVDPAGFAKRLEIRPDGDELVVGHELTWAGEEPATAGAWAITQVPLGGQAIVPVGGIAPDGQGLQADRSLVLWPYTDLTDPRLSFRSSAVVVDSQPREPVKVGSGPSPGRLGYLRDGWLFTKTVTPAGEGDFPDRGAVGQVFADRSFCELESLGPLVHLQPGDTIAHEERWHASPCPDLDTAVARVMGEG